MLTFNRKHFDALAGSTRDRWLALYAVWLAVDFPGQSPDRPLDVFLNEMDLAARELGARSPQDIYRVIALAFLPPGVADVPQVAASIGRALVDVEVSVDDRLRFIDQLIASRAPWPPARRALGAG